MRPRHRKLTVRFGRATRFELAPGPAAPFRGEVETKLDGFKDRLLFRLLSQTSDEQLASALRHAANEAAALAWTTPFPLLFLPALLEEKAQAARHYARRQARMKQRSRSTIALAA